MAFTFPAMVAWDNGSNTAVKNAVFQVYATSDTGFASPLAITDSFGNPLAGNYLRSGAIGTFAQFQQATNSTVVISDPAHIYAWTISCAPTDASTANLVTQPLTAAALNAAYAPLAAPAVQISTKQFTATSPAAGRSPFNVSMTMDGSQLGTTGLSEKVGLNNTIKFQGDFTQETVKGALSPTILFGSNDYIVSGTNSGDLNGITDVYARLTEVHMWAPGVTLNVLKALAVEAHLEPSAVGGHINNLYGIFIQAPRNGGTIDNAYGLYINSPVTATANHAIYVSGGGLSYFTGGITLENQTMDAMSGTVKAGNIIAGPVGSPSAGTLTANASSPSTVGLTVIGAPSQIANLQDWKDSTSNVKASISHNGIAAFNAINIGAGMIDNSTGTGLTIKQPAPNARALTVSAIASSTADIQAWSNSLGSALSRIGKGGHYISIVSTAPALTDLVDGEFALYTDSSGNLKISSRVSGVLKVGTVTVS